MSLYFRSLASGSSGNSYLIKTDNTAVLVDTGTAGKHIIKGLEDSGLAPADLSAVLLTHEHVDHVKSIRMISKKAENAFVLGSRGTLKAISDKIPRDRSKAVRAEMESFRVGDLLIRPFALSHDAAEPLGYSFEADGRKATIVTDTGFVTDGEYEQLVDSDLLVLEANHERNLLLMGRYPYPLKVRILGEQGHISNDTCADTLIRVIRERSRAGIPKVALAHLSKENNSPDIALMTIRNRLFEEALVEDRDYAMTVLMRDTAGEMIEV